MSGQTIKSGLVLFHIASSGKKSDIKTEKSIPRVAVAGKHL